MSYHLEGKSLPQALFKKREMVAFIVRAFQIEKLDGKMYSGSHSKAVGGMGLESRGPATQFSAL